MKLSPAPVVSLTSSCTPLHPQASSLTRAACTVLLQHMHEVKVGCLEQHKLPGSCLLQLTLTPAEQVLPGPVPCLGRQWRPQ